MISQYRRKTVSIDGPILLISTSKKIPQRYWLLIDYTKCGLFKEISQYKQKLISTDDTVRLLISLGETYLNTLMVLVICRFHKKLVVQQYIDANKNSSVQMTETYHWLLQKRHISTPWWCYEWWYYRFSLYSYFQIKSLNFKYIRVVQIRNENVQILSKFPIYKIMKYSCLIPHFYL